MTADGHLSAGGHLAAPAAGPAPGAPPRPDADPRPPAARRRTGRGKLRNRVREGRARWVLPTQRWLVLYLVAAGAVLAFDSLYAYALEQNQRPSWLVADVIPSGTFLPRQLLAFVWATVVEGLLAAGGLGIKADRRDWRAWVLLCVGVPATLAFQVLHIWPILGRAVPTVAWLLALIVLELPRQSKAKARGALGSALGGTSQGSPDRAAALGGAPGGALGGGAAGDGGGEKRPRRLPPPSPAQAELAATLWAQGTSKRKIRDALADAGLAIGWDKLSQYLDSLPPPPTPALVAGNGSGGAAPSGRQPGEGVVPGDGSADAGT